MKSEREDKALKKAIGKLPEFSPSDQLWNDIEEELDVKTQKVGISKRKWLRYVATLILLASFSVIWYAMVVQKKSDLSFGEEVSELRANALMKPDNNADFEEFIEVECSGYRELCQKSEFKQLILQLTEVEVEVTNIGLMIETTGYDKFLYKAKAKADQETVRIKKELVKLLRG